MVNTKPIRSFVQSAVNDWQTPLLSGIEYYEKFDGTKYNQPVNRVVLFIPNPDSTEHMQYYDKINLAPGWESIPYLSLFHKAGIRFGNEYKFHRKGDRIRLFDIPGQKRHFTVGAPICFEQNAPWLWNRMVRLGAEAFHSGVVRELVRKNLFPEAGGLHHPAPGDRDPACGGPVLEWRIDVFRGSVRQDIFPGARPGIFDNRFHRAFRTVHVLHAASKSFPVFCLVISIGYGVRLLNRDRKQKTFTTAAKEDKIGHLLGQ